MTPVDPVAAVLATPPVALPLGPVPVPVAEPAGGFAATLRSGLATMETRLAEADTLVRRFALGDDIPMHRVTYALEEARLSVELAMQVRGRLLDGYRELMGMQL